MLHQFSQPIAHIALPEKFTYPFHYTPHPLCMIAANELQDYIATREEWKEELAKCEEVKDWDAALKLTQKVIEDDPDIMPPWPRRAAVSSASSPART